MSVMIYCSHGKLETDKCSDRQGKRDTTILLASGGMDVGGDKGVVISIHGVPKSHLEEH